MNIVLVPVSAKVLSILIVLFMCLSAIILWILRSKFELGRNSLVSSIIDTMIAFIAGGNLRMHHKIERYFFGIQLFSAFFIISLFSGGLLFYIHRILNQEITMFKELTEIDSPIYINPSLEVYGHVIQGMLRCVYINQFIDSKLRNFCPFFFQEQNWFEHQLPQCRDNRRISS